MRVLLALLALLLSGSPTSSLNLLPQAARRVQQTSTRLHMAEMQTGSVPGSSRAGAGKALTAASVALPALLAGLLAPRAANAALQTFLKEPTADFVAENDKVAKFAAEQIKVRKAWDVLVANFEKSESPADLEAAVRAMRIFLIKMPSQIPSGVKKQELVKTCRKKKLIGKSRKSQPNWTTKVEIEYQALIQQFNKNFNPDNRTEEKIY